jgi:hypothetical protein
MRLVIPLVAALAAAAAQTTPSSEQAELFHRKLLLVISHSPTASGEAGRTRRTTFTESETNSYLRYKISPTLPTGVTDPSVSLAGQGRISGRAVVDLDRVRKQSSGGWLDPTAYLGGRLPVTATGLLTTGDGSGRFQLETAEVTGVPIPKVLLKEIVAYYTRSTDNPNGIDFEQAFDLPAGIRQIDVEVGRAVVVQ